MKNEYRDIKRVLMENHMEEGEAKAVALLMMEKVCGMTTTEVLINEPKGEMHREMILAMGKWIAVGAPVQ